MKIIVHEEKIRAELAQPSGKRRGDPMKLQPAELRVLLLLLQGVISTDIAAQLRISRSAVSTLATSIHSKLNASNAMHLAYLAYERGYVVMEEA